MRPWVNSRAERDDARSISCDPGRINAPPTFIPRPVGGAFMRPWVDSRAERDDARSIPRGPGRMNAPPTFIVPP